MNSFTAKCATATAAPPDPRKHVNYVQGMVLGADDMIQDFVYHQHQREWLARDAIGYGTLSGLQVGVVTRDPAKGPEVSVSPGSALSPRGKLIRVAPQQCAALNQWLALADTQTQLRNFGVSLSGSAFVTVYVTLCFRDCQVDPLPIPGEPCRCDDQAMAPSRVQDDFRLELRLASPVQAEEDAIRDFVHWLRQIEVDDSGSGGSSLEDFLNALRAAAQEGASPPQSVADFLALSPPEGIVIPAGSLCEYLRSALRVWVTELRPLWQTQWAEQIGGGCGCHGQAQTTGEDGECCLLLAALNLPLANGQIDPGQSVTIDEERRPFVVHLRMLQELVLCGKYIAAASSGSSTSPPSSSLAVRNFATVFALDAQTLRLWLHYPTPVDVPSAAIQQLEVDGQIISGFSVTPVASTGADINVFDITLDDSPVISLEEGQRFLVAINLELVIEAGSPPLPLSQALADAQWQYPDQIDDVVMVYGSITLPVSTVNPVGPLTGDVVGPEQSNTVARIQGVPVQSPPQTLTDGMTLVVKVNNNVPDLEWTTPAVVTPPPAPAFDIVAAGRFDVAQNVGDAAQPIFAFNGLTATLIVNPGIYFLQSPKIVKGGHYIVSGAPVTPSNPFGFFFEVIDERDKTLLTMVSRLAKARTIKSIQGIALRVENMDQKTPPTGFMVQITQFR